MKNRRLPTNFVRDVIMKAPSQDIMNSLTKSVLTLSSYDDNVTDKSIASVPESDQSVPDADDLWLSCI